MPDDNAATPASYELRPDAAKRMRPRSPAAADHQALSAEVLCRNTAWFIRLRWGVVASVAVLLLLALTPLPARVGLDLRPAWLAVMGVVLGCGNLAYRHHHRRCRANDCRNVTANLTAQIIVDLLLVTVVVNRVGSHLTFAPFLYVIHIVLACVFFPARTSVLVLLFSAGLYASCTVLEATGIIPVHNVFLGLAKDAMPPAARFWHVLSALLLWGTIWAVVARLADMLRDRERELLEAQQQALKTYEVGQQHMHHTSHQMKSPLDAIRTNVDLLKHGFGGDMSTKAIGLLDKIDARANALADFISDMLRLADLKAGESLKEHRTQLDVAAILKARLATVADVAARRNIRLDTDLQPTTVAGDANAIEMMLDNLLTNAVNYSYDGGHVRVTCRPALDGPEVEVADAGIGIPAASLARVFDDYYRTREAKHHNPRSTGVGLAIVRQVAESHHIHVRVESAPGHGTTFRLRFPPAATAGGDA